MVTRTNIESKAPVPEWISRFVADIPSAVALFDAELRYIAANYRWLNAFGIAADALIGQPHEHVDPPSASIMRDLHRRALSGRAIEASLTEESGRRGRHASHRQRAASPRPRRVDPRRRRHAARGAGDRHRKIAAICDRRADRARRPPLLHGAGTFGRRSRLRAAPSGGDLSARYRQFQRRQRSPRRQRRRRGVAGNRQPPARRHAVVLAAAAARRPEKPVATHRHGVAPRRRRVRDHPRQPGTEPGPGRGVRPAPVAARGEPGAGRRPGIAFRPISAISSRPNRTLPKTRPCATSTSRCRKPRSAALATPRHGSRP